MKIAIRADASNKIGFGHIYRCLALADGVRRDQAEVFFLCRKIEGDLIAWLENDRGHVVHVLPEGGDDSTSTREVLKQKNGVDWLIIDHYAIGADWEVLVRDQARHILVIDDLANRPHDCDVLVNQSILDSQFKGYDALVSPGCRLLLGPRYALLRREFLEQRGGLRKGPKPKTPRKILVFFGGGEHELFSYKFFAATERLKDLGLEFHLVGSHPRLEAGHASAKNIIHHPTVLDMAALMTEMDLYVGSGGSITWERCCLGLSGVVVAMADNQRPLSQGLGDGGCHLYLGREDEVSPQDLATAIRLLWRQPERIHEMSKKSFALVDGLGVERVIAGCL